MFGPTLFAAFPTILDELGRRGMLNYRVETIWPTAKPIEHQIEDGNYPIRGAMEVWLKEPPPVDKPD